MAQGRFAEAEDRFRTYRFVAPDQANPHDSLGELLVLLGRFDEAQKELEAALAIRPDFCSSYVDLIEAARLSGHPERMPELIRELEKSRCGGEWVARTKCFDRMWRLYLARDWKALAAFFHDPCIQEGEAPALFPHLAAVLGGDLALARQIEAFAAKQGSSYMTREDPVVPHTAAIREVAEGKLPDALAHFARTDALIEYRGLPDGLFKLYNRLQWAHALELAGDHAGAERLLREVASVNQAMAARYVGLPTPQPPAGMATAGAPAPAANTPGAGAS
jgi:tetratricopeptide (TPR) repeat protein